MHDGTGYISGYEVGSKVGSHWEGLLGSISSAYKRRSKERNKQDEEERSLQNELIKLTAIENVKSKRLNNLLTMFGLSRSNKGTIKPDNNTKNLFKKTLFDAISGSQSELKG